jgi:hypothetical protein
VARDLGDCLARIRHRGGRFMITIGNRPVTELGPECDAQETTPGVLRAALREIRADADFAANLKRVNAADAMMENPRG